MRIWLFVGAFLSICALQNPQAPPKMVALPAASAEARLADRVLAAAYRPGSWRRLERTDFNLLYDAVEGGSKLLAKSGRAWIRVPVTHFAGDVVYLYYVIHNASKAGAEEAPNLELRHRYRDIQLDVVMTLLRDPRTQLVCDHWIRDDGRATPDDGEWVTIHHLTGDDLPGVRAGLKRDGRLRPEQWGVLVGLNWNDGPGVAFSKENIPFVEAGALAAAGVDLRVAGSVVRIVNDRARITIPIGTGGPTSPRYAFRDKRGRLYVPTYELQRGGVHAVLVYPEAQMIHVLAAPPSPKTRDTDAFTGKPLP